jgi:hypothetical protein
VRGAEQARKTLDTYCVGCHNTRAKAGGLALDATPVDAVSEHPDVWEAAVRKLRGRLMPPPGTKQPEQSEIDTFVSWMEAQLDAAAARGPAAGHVPVQRMTRTEYATAVNDLLGLELQATDILPAEIEVNGFENVATALTVSPAFLDQYVAAARKAARLAVGEPVPKVSSAHHVKTKGDDQAAHIDGLPLGTRGGMKFRHTFPADGEYRFTFPDLGVDLYTRVVETKHTLVLLIDGREVFRESLGGPEDMKTVDRGGAPGRAKVMERFTNVPVQVKAGTYDVAVAFIERARRVQPRRPHPAPGGRRHGARTVQRHRRVGDAEPPEGVRVSHGRSSVHAAHRRQPGAPRLPPPGDRGGSGVAPPLLRRRAEITRRVRHWRRAPDCGRAREPRVLVSGGVGRRV